MATSFKYALVEINNNPVLVDQRTIDEATTALRNGLKELKEDTLKKGFALQTPEGMNPVVLGSVSNFSDWATKKMDLVFSLKDEIKKLPDPFKSGLSGLANTDLVLYSAALFYTGVSQTEKPKTTNLYGELVIGFRIPDTFMQDFPLALREIVLAVNNFPAPKPI